jgi:hypothetical protein
MGTPSIFNQVKSALETVVMSEADQKAYKAEHGVDSVKKALRYKGKPNPQPVGYPGQAHVFRLPGNLHQVL